MNELANRTSGRRMSKPNKNKALLRIESELMQIIKASPTHHKITPAPKLPREWAELVEKIDSLWP